MYWLPICPDSMTLPPWPPGTAAVNSAATPVLPETDGGALTVRTALAWCPGRMVKLAGLTCAQDG